MEKTVSPSVDLPAAETVRLDADRRAHWRKRKQYVVDRSFQHRIGRQLLVAVLLGMVLATYVTYVMGWRYGVYLAGGVSGPNMPWNEHVMYWGFAIGSLISGAAILYYVAVVFAHRVAGPAVKLTKAVRRLAQGGLEQPVRLRDTDFLHELASAVNQADQSWRETIEQIHAALEPLETDTDELDAAAVRGQVKAIRAAISRYPQYGSKTAGTTGTPEGSR